REPARRGRRRLARVQRARDRLPEPRARGGRAVRAGARRRAAAARAPARGSRLSAAAARATFGDDTRRAPTEEGVLSATRVTFTSDGLELVGILRLPEGAGSEPRPGLVFTGPIT